MERDGESSRAIASQAGSPAIKIAPWTRLRRRPGGLLAGLLEPLGRALTPASTREILALEASKSAQARIGELARRCDQELLTPEEKTEYQIFVVVGDIVALLKARARIFLAEHLGA